MKGVVLNDEAYRRSFLKGLFAAEGHVKHSVYNTLESINFAFNPKTEKWIALYVQKCLVKEEIKSKIKNGELYICNYNNMLKLRLLKSLDLHKEKKEKFLRLCKNDKIHLYFDKGTVKGFIEGSQSKVAKKWGVSQATISNYNIRDYMGLKLAKKLMSKKELIKKVKYIKITNNTVRNKECVRFMVNIIK